MTRTRIACLALLATSCAVVTAVTGGLNAAAHWAEGFVNGTGPVVDGLQQGEWTFTGEDGQTRAEGAYKDDSQEGPWVYYHPNGNKEYEGTFADERRVGLWRYWHANGSPKAQGHFERGRELGLWTFWDTKGQLTQRGYFADGLQVNRWTYWHSDGSRRAEGWFHDGQKIGVWTFRDRSGAATEKDFGLDEGLTIAVEDWPDGTPRREGVLRDGLPHGFWITRHASGEVRVEGVFDRGQPVGTWVAYRADGERLAAGEVERGRPVGLWTTWTAAGSRTWSASGASPAIPSLGDWSDASLADRADVEEVLATWLSEASSELDPEALEPARTAAGEPASDEQVAEVAVEPEVPVNAQPWTRREIEEFRDYVEAYTRIAVDRTAIASRYTNRAASTPDREEDLVGGGNPAKAREYVGKPLPLTVYKDTAGKPFDISELRGKRVVLVVLRGFSGKVCVYCTAQTEALCEAGAFERFEEQGVRLLVVYPGGKSELEAFKRGFESLGSTSVPPYGLLYERDAVVCRSMDLEGDKVIPSTFILDEQGVVRFAYIGEHEADRPPVELLFQALDELEPAG